MLAQLTIRDFAIIDRLTIEWSRGLNVVTGETGAGKSIIIDAVGALLEREGESGQRVLAAVAGRAAMGDDLGHVGRVVAGAGGPRELVPWATRVPSSPDKQRPPDA